jgi:hypothetical protein
MMGKAVARNMYSFMTEQIWLKSASGLLLKINLSFCNYITIELLGNM